MEQLILQGGVAGATLAVLYLTVKRRDDFLDKLISNHFKHHNENLEKLSKSIDKLSNKIK